jgi:hypothetical protein
MFIIRDIFHLRFGAYREAKLLLEEALQQGLMPQGKSKRVLTDFTGDSYRLIFEEGFDTLADYEKALASGMKEEQWKKWYEKFKLFVLNSKREILKEVL